MSYWNAKEFLRFLGKIFFNNRGTNYRLTTKRLGVILLAMAIYLPAEMIIWLFWGLDELFFPGYRQIQIPKPVFIIGNPRSGTTFLQRTLAKDQANFHSMRTWEIFGAPSISFRRLVRRLVRIGRAVGVPISRRIRKIEGLWKESDRIHRLKLRAPEEDEYLFIHNFSTMKIWSFAAMEEESDPYIFFDQRISDQDKNRMMDFYESCIKRHYYYHGGRKRHYLSKNPNFSPAIDTLLDRFPEGKFIYLIRSPLDAVPSHISLKDREWHILGSPLEKYSCKDFIIRSSRHWYEYPLKRLSELPDNQAVIVRFDELVTDTRNTVKQIYQQLELPLGREFEEILALATERARNHESQHDYSLGDMGIEEQELREEFRQVFDRFEFKDLET